MRRLRRSEGLRALVRETSLEPGDLIYPLFLCPGEGIRREVSSMPGVFNLSIDEAVKEVRHFYSNYHSLRYHRDELILRLHRGLTPAQIAELT